jgi:catechol 2,3-dioxygenase-like lactoylglutathione lyase family enzyme
MITQIRHTGITVQNLEKCLNFFVDKLGFQIVKRMDESGDYIDAMHNLSGVVVTTVKIEAHDGNIIELLKFKSHKVEDDESWSGKIYSTGLTHLAFTVRDLNKTYEDLKNKGVKFNAPPQYSPDGYAKVTFCRGPEGLFLELVEVRDQLN